jgi:hypothetical protein
MHEDNMNPELLLKMLFKFMGINEEQLQLIFADGRQRLIDAQQKIASIDARLERIERKLDIPETLAEMKAIENGNHR